MLRRNSLANANGFANEMAKSSSSLRKFLANGCLRQNSLAIANAMAWCTQKRRPVTIHPDTTPSFNAKSPGKFEERIHKSFLESRQSNVWGDRPLPAWGKSFISTSFSFLPESLPFLGPQGTQPSGAGMPRGVWRVTRQEKEGISFKMARTTWSE